MIAAAALVAGGCALAPGQHAAGERYSVGDVEQWDSEFTTIPITADLLRDFATRADAAASPSVASVDRDGWEYLIGPQDVLAVVVWGHPELTIPAGQYRSAAEAGHKVSADGTIFFPYVGIISVAGKTVREVRALVSDGIADYIKDPQVDIRIAAFQSQRVYMVGEVESPAVLPVTDVPMTVLDALNMVGGPAGEADLSRVTVTRNGTVHPINLQALIEAGDLDQDMLLRDGDLVHVPDRSANRVYVLGEVRRPQALLMHRGRMTLAEAIGRVEGFDQTASEPARVFVIRGDLSYTR